MDKDTIDKVFSSYGRFALNEKFYDHFYTTFLASHEDIPSYFTKTDFVKQKQLLRLGISFMILFVKDNPAGLGALKRLASLHDKDHLNIPTNLYPYWLESLCKSVQAFDPQYTSELERAWKEVMQSGIDYFIQYS